MDEVDDDETGLTETDSQSHEIGIGIHSSALSSGIGNGFNASIGD